MKGLPEGLIELKHHMSTPVQDDIIVIIMIGVGNKEDPYNSDDAKQLQFVADEFQKIILRKRAEDSLASMNQLLEQKVKPK